MTVQGKGKRRREKNLRKAEAERYGFRLPPPPLKQKGKGTAKERDMPRNLRRLMPFLNPDKDQPKKTRNKYAYKHRQEGEDEQETATATADRAEAAELPSAEGGEGTGAEACADGSGDASGGAGEAGTAGGDGDGMGEGEGKSRSEREREKAINRQIRKATGGKLFPGAEEQQALDAQHSKRKLNKKNYLNMKKLGKKIKRKGIDPKAADVEHEEYEATKFGHLSDAVGFGEVAQMPPRITIKRRGGGGAAGGEVGDQGRHGRLFQEIMQRAAGKADKAARRPPPSLHQEAVRNDVIEKYRTLKGTQKPKLPSTPMALAEGGEPERAPKRRKQK